jgi:hypothetical protein
MERAKSRFMTKHFLGFWPPSDKASGGSREPRFESDGALKVEILRLVADDVSSKADQPLTSNSAGDSFKVAQNC